MKKCFRCLLPMLIFSLLVCSCATKSNLTENNTVQPTSYEALKTNKGVCHTYTYLCEFTLQQLRIECLRFSGDMTDKKDEGHMWLVVRID